MVFRTGISFFTAICLLAEIGCQEFEGRFPFAGRNQFDDISADFDFSRSSVLVKNKRYDNGGEADSLTEGSDNSNDDTEPWPGRWLPEKVVPEKHRVVSKRLNDTLDQNHIQSMTSTINDDCDNGKANLSVDWSGSPENYTCFKKMIFEPDPDTAAFILHDYIPVAYHARHACMDKEIHYDSFLPTFGTHRPAWARYGEYKFLPRQRWLHNLEHGGVVMLYHPCAHPLMVSKLRDIVTSCLYRHIISPYTLLSEKRPLAIVTWGWAMIMSHVHQHNVERFIKEHALQGPEKLSQDGNYDYLLEKPAEIITTVDDDTLCPNSIQHHM
ncbi:uncharacterized protein LOC142324201 isoform X1 [Lycorma delicatula]|uniref:uncharacterized protein LOC142324201 isoform X1 n=1 Tax=Lycorma delicatula TaxID=130591 RepID=UPI003F519FE2